MVFSATNNERQFFGKITGFSGGYYSWTEVYADGVAVGAGDEPQSGSRAVNSYYGTGDLTNVVPNDKVVLMEYLPSDTDSDLVGFCVALEANGKDILGDDYTTQPSSIPVPYPDNVTGDPVQHGNDGALIRVIERDDPDHAGQRILQIYHLPPTVEDTTREYDTIDSTTDAGVPEAGGAVGSFAITPRTIKMDAWGHQMSDEDASDITVTAGDHIEIVGTDDAVVIQHSEPGESDLAVASPQVDLSPAATDTPGGSLTVHLFNEAIDGLGHIDIEDSESTDLTVSGGNKIGLVGTAPDMTIDYIDAEDGEPEPITEFLTDITFAIVGSDIVATLTKVTLYKTIDSYGKVTDITIGESSTVDRTITGEACP